MGELTESSNKITQKIVSWKVKQDSEIMEERLTKEEWELRYPQVVSVSPEKKKNDRLIRDPILSGKSYKIRTSKEEHSLYVTINDQLNAEGKLAAFEIFINSKNVMHQQWMTALTRVISAVFRISNDPSFLIEELASVFDANGGHFTKGSKTKKGKFMPSLVAEIGEVINLHLAHIKIANDKLLTKEGLGKGDDRTATQIIDIPLEKVVSTVLDVMVEETLANNEQDPVYPKGSQLCPECYTVAMIKVEGCNQCLACSYSKCG